jgi:hypothetical protein
VPAHWGRLARSRSWFPATTAAARQPNVTLDIEPGGGHNMATWRALVPLLLEWMTFRPAARNGTRSAPSRLGAASHRGANGQRADHNPCRQMFPSPSLGPPKLSLSPSPPPFCGMPVGADPLPEPELPAEPLPDPEAPPEPPAIMWWW